MDEPPTYKASQCSECKYITPSTIRWGFYGRFCKNKHYKSHLFIETLNQDNNCKYFKEPFLKGLAKKITQQF